MNKLIKLSTFTLALLFAVSTASAVPSIIIKGEADLLRSNGQIAHVDWIVANDDIATGITPADFIFISGASFTGKGDKTAYDGSTWFYYYQVENTSTSNLSAFTLSFPNPDVITSMGHIVNADIDTDLDNGSHTGTLDFGGPDNEDASAAGGDLLVNPSGHDFDSNPSDPNATWNFQGGANILSGDYSTILFLTSNTPPIDSDATLLNGSPFSGILPVPSTSSPVVPEPFSIILLSGSIVGLILKRRK